METDRRVGEGSDLLIDSTNAERTEEFAKAAQTMLQR
jgi:hypothetical protein